MLTVAVGRPVHSLGRTVGPEGRAVRSARCMLPDTRGVAERSKAAVLEGGMETAMTMTRRSVLRLSLGLGGMALTAGAIGLLWVRRKLDPRTLVGERFLEAAAPPGRLAPTPACEDDDAEPTETAPEGPFYIPNSPERAVVREPGVIGTPLVLTGRVLSTDCRPLAGVVLDFWNCDGTGNYDEGFKLRGHQFTDEKGTYRLETVKPADYEIGGLHRAPHIHVKVQGRGSRLLTTQIFFPGEPLNTQDRFFQEGLTMKLGSSGDRSRVGRFDFVLA